MKTIINVLLAAVPICGFCQQENASDFTGVWSGVMTTQSEEYWQVEDFICFPGCPKASYQYMIELLDDPANDDIPTGAINGMVYRHMREHLAQLVNEEGKRRQNSYTDDNRDMTSFCEPYGYVRQIVNTLPMAIRREGRNLVIDYEEWSLRRTIYMDGRDHPSDLEATPLGHSIGRFENPETLVVETVGISPGVFYSHQTGGSHSDQLRGTERYSLNDDPKRLTLELTLEDPVTLNEPLVITKTWLATPNIALLEDRCGDIPGQP